MRVQYAYFGTGWGPGRGNRPKLEIGPNGRWRRQHRGGRNDGSWARIRVNFTGAAA